MLYSSFFRPHGSSILCSYAPSAGGIGIGVTGGGVDTEGGGDAKHLTWEELKRDLLLASHWSEYLYVFSLEGCVRQGFMQKIAELDWVESMPEPTFGVKKVNLIRGSMQAFLWLTSRPLLILSLVMLSWWSIRRRK